jgi:uncharacterized membrane protein (DUF4010 family)
MIDIHSASILTMFLNFILALAVGVTIGVERTVNLRDDWKMAGMRDFIMVAALSYVSSLFYQEVPLAWICSFLTVILFTLSIFIIRNIKAMDKTLGMTTLLAMPFTFLVASLPNFGAPLWSVATIVFTVLLVLGMKVRFYQFAHTIERHEIIDFAILIGIAISITPLIPVDARIPIPLFDMIESGIHVTYHYVMVAVLWKVVVMVSLMSFVAHFVTKYTKGKYGLMIATFLGGLVSSLAAVSMMLRNRSNDVAAPASVEIDVDRLTPREIFLGFVSSVTGAILRVIIVLRLALGYDLFVPFMFPLMSLLVLFASITIYVFAGLDDTKTRTVRFAKRPLPLYFIVKFSGILAVLIIIMSMATHYLGNEAFIMVSFLSGIVSSAAAAVSVGTNMMQENGVGLWTAGLSIIGALLGSILAKVSLISKHLGARHSLAFLLPLLAAAVVGFVTLWISLSATAG